MIFFTIEAGNGGFIFTNHTAGYFYTLHFALLIKTGYLYTLPFFIRTGYFYTLYFALK